MLWCAALMCSYLHGAVVHAHSFAGSSSCLWTGALICLDSFAHIIFADVCRYLRTPEQLLSLALNIAIAASPQCCPWECNPLKIIGLRFLQTFFFLTLYGIFSLSYVFSQLCHFSLIFSDIYVLV